MVISKKHIKRIIFSLIVLCSASRSHAADASASNLLLSSFGARCSTSGDLNTKSQNQLQNLSQVYDVMKNDPKCQGVVSAYQKFRNSLGEFQSHVRAAQIVEAEGMVQDLAAAIQTEKSKGANADAEYISALQSGLTAKQLELFRARQSKDIRDKGTQYRALGSAYNFSKNLMDSLSHSSECINQNPSIGAEIAAQVMSFAGQFSSGMLSGGLLAGSEILDRVVVFTRDRKLGKAMQNLDRASLVDGIGCAYEQLAHTWCQARDFQNLLSSSTEGGVCDECNKHEEGLTILKTQLDVYSQWVQRLNAGSPPVTPGQASDKALAYTLQFKYDILSTNLDSQIATGERNVIDQDNSLNAKEAFIEDIANSLVLAADIQGRCENGVCSTEKGVASDFFARDPHCGPKAFLYSKGMDRQCAIQSGENCNSCIARKYPTVPEVSDVKEAINTFKLEIQKYVKREAQKYLETDCILSLSKIDSTGSANASAREFLVNSRSYFARRLGDSDSVLNSTKILKSGIEDAVKRIDQSLSILDASFFENPQCKDISITLTENLAPSNNIFFISDKLNELVQQEYAHSFKNIQGEGDIAQLSAYSVREAVAQIMNEYPNPIAASTQAEAAQRNAQNALGTLADVFDNEFEEEVLDLNDKKMNPTLKALHCFRRASSAAPMSRKMNSACSDAELSYGSKDKPVRIRYADMPKEGSGRMCYLYDFLRKTEVERRKISK